MSGSCTLGSVVCVIVFHISPCSYSIIQFPFLQPARVGFLDFKAQTRYFCLHACSLTPSGSESKLIRLKHLDFDEVKKWILFSYSFSKHTQIFCFFLDQNAKRKLSKATYNFLISCWWQNPFPPHKFLNVAPPEILLRLEFWRKKLCLYCTLLIFWWQTFEYWKSSQIYKNNKKVVQFNLIPLMQISSKI